MSATGRRIDVRPVVLEGVHVRLEPLSRDHLEGIIAAGSDPAIFRWMPVQPRTRDDFERWLDRALADAASGAQVPFATVEQATGQVVGSTRFLAISPHDRRLEIGWTWLAPQAQRTRANTEAKYLQLRHCFEQLACLRVELKTDSRNEASQRAIRRIGATYEGTFRKHLAMPDGVQRDSVWFSITDDEWPDVKRRLEALLAR